MTMVLPRCERDVAEDGQDRFSDVARKMDARVPEVGGHGTLHVLAGPVWVAGAELAPPPLR